MNLRNRVGTLLRDVIRMCDGCPGAESFRDTVADMLARVEEPLRVAVVGVMKAGKSTLMNALLKEPVLVTGTVETTYTVSWFRYADTPSLQIRFRDGGTLEAPFSDLSLWTVRARLAENPRMDDVEYLVIRYPNEVLRRMELIDTPGLLSTYGTDSANTLSFLGLGQQADEATRREASRADAVVYAFSRGLQQSNAELLERFHGDLGNATPINALGVLTQADLFQDGVHDPLELARSITTGLMREPQVRRLLYATVPVSARLVEKAGVLDTSNWETLIRLSALEPALLADVLADLRLFGTMPAVEMAEALEAPGCAALIGTPEERSAVAGLLGRYGVLLAAEALREGGNRETVLARLAARSGMEELERLLMRHFGNRSLLIKLRYVFTHLRHAAAELRKQGAPRNVLETADFLLEEVDAIETGEQAFRELGVLQAWYSGLLTLDSPAEIEEILRLTGEYGISCAARLGLPEEASLRELEAAARRCAAQWNARANDFLASRAQTQAAGVMARSCDGMHQHLQALLGIDWAG